MPTFWHTAGIFQRFPGLIYQKKCRSTILVSALYPKHTRRYKKLKIQLLFSKSYVTICTGGIWELTHSENPFLHLNIPTYVQGNLVNISFYPSVGNRSQRGQVNPNFRRCFVQCLIFSLSISVYPHHLVWGHKDGGGRYLFVKCIDIGISKAYCGESPN